jgi:hypothetical protein
MQREGYSNRSISIQPTPSIGVYISLELLGPLITVTFLRDSSGPGPRLVLVAYNSKSSGHVHSKS